MVAEGCDQVTPEERQALREKHKCCPCGYCLSDECEAGCVGDYPCDVIKVLDATENLNPTDLKTEVECDHEKHYYGWLTSNNGDTLYHVEFTYCPKCGEEL